MEPSTQSCGTCRYFTLRQRDSGALWGFCRRYPPRNVSPAGLFDWMHGATTSSQAVMFPLVPSTELCGEYKQQIGGPVN